MNFQISDEICIQRIQGRLICPMCNSSYSLAEKRINCATCNIALQHRQGDDYESTVSRLKYYRDQTESLIH